MVIYADDLGYGDITAYGATDIDTPNIDRIANAGVKFTNFYNTSSACSTSRTSLLTGSYHARASLYTALDPSSSLGLHPDEVTIAEMLNVAGYQSAMVGKWHLGHTSNMMPWNQGFDRFYGIPVSHDYSDGGPYHPAGVPIYSKEPGRSYSLESTVSATDSGQIALYTQRFANKAVDYIRERDVSKPLFLYVAQPMPHVGLATTDAFAGSSRRGLYGDVVQELDASVGTILQALEDEGIAENTLVVFASDNGPWLSYGNHAGNAGGLREGKRTVFEGGVRTPAVMSWPSRIAPGQVVDAPAAILDLFPTFAGIAGADLPADRVIDGVDLASLVLAESESDYDEQRPIAFYDYRSRDLHALRSGRWKAVFDHQYETVNQVGANGVPGSYRLAYTPNALYDLESDPGETTNVLAWFPEVFAELDSLADRIRADLGDDRTNTPPGLNVRPLGSGALLQLPEFSPGGADGLVAHYAFERNALDSAGPPFADGRVGSAVEFKAASSGEAAWFSQVGTSSSVIAVAQADAFDPGAGSFSIAFWISRDDDRLHNGIIDALSSTGYQILALPAGVQGGAIRIRLDSTESGPVLFDSNASLRAGKLTHVAVTLDRTAGELTWYIDGQPEPPQDASAIVGRLTPSQDLWIGAINLGSTAGLNGLLDDLRFYDHALSLSEVSRLIETLQVPGDFNSDGYVDAADYAVWRNGYGVQYDHEDYLVWRKNYGAMREILLVSPNAIATPSPGGLGLVALGGAALMMRRRV